MRLLFMPDYFADPLCSWCYGFSPVIGALAKQFAGRLPVRHVIHTVGPVWTGGTAQEPELLASCYRRCLELADAQGLTSIAFPAISCGVYGYPLRSATAIAVRTVRAFGEQARSLRQRTVLAPAGHAAINQARVDA